MPPTNTPAVAPIVVPTIVFALAPGGGNPGPVVFGGDALTAEAMRGVAEQLGAEAAFVLPPTRRDCAVRLRYFVPRHEMEMCVHGTVAAVTVLAGRGVLADGVARVETPLGPITVTCDWEALWAACDRLDVTGVYPFTLRPRAPGRAQVEARQFPRRAGYPEDAATGVAAAALGAYLARHERLPCAARPDGWAAVRIAQGHAMGRPSALTAEVRVDGAAPIRTRVRGRATVGPVG